MLMHIVNETRWDRTETDSLYDYCDAEDDFMSEDVDFIFYSDTGLQMALHELDGLALDDMEYRGDTLTVSGADYAAMGDSILAIVKENGGDLSN